MHVLNLVYIKKLIMIKGYTENNGVVQMNQNDRMCNKNYKFIKFQQFSEC